MKKTTTTTTTFEASSDSRARKEGREGGREAKLASSVTANEAETRYGITRARYAALQFRQRSNEVHISVHVRVIYIEKPQRGSTFRFTQHENIFISPSIFLSPSVFLPRPFLFIANSSPGMSELSQT